MSTHPSEGSGGFTNWICRYLLLLLEENFNIFWNMNDEIKRIFGDYLHSLCVLMVIKIIWFISFTHYQVFLLMMHVTFKTYTKASKWGNNVCSTTVISLFRSILSSTNRNVNVKSIQKQRRKKTEASEARAPSYHIKARFTWRKGDPSSKGNFTSKVTLPLRGHCGFVLITDVIFFVFF